MSPTTDSRELPELSAEEMTRYARHLVLPEVGLEGQRRLKAAKVLCVGAGGLGSPLALYLTAAGVGTLGLVDFDTVDASNLQRQILHSTHDIGRSKLDSAAEKLSALNPATTIIRHHARLTSANALEILAGYEIIADGSDNFPTRYLVNDACVLLARPNVYGSVHRFEGQASVFCTEHGPCYRCLYPEPPPPESIPNCAEGGVLGILPGLVGIIQATEVIKFILGPILQEAVEPLIGRLLHVDALKLRFQCHRINKNPDCPACGTNPAIRQLIDYNQFCGTLPQPTKETRSMNGIPQMSAKELKQKLKNGEEIFILDVREVHEYQSANIGGLLMPMNTVPARLHEIPRDCDVVVQCHSGARSQAVAEFLARNGFTRVTNLTGGILAWGKEEVR